MAASIESIIEVVVVLKYSHEEYGDSSFLFTLSFAIAIPAVPLAIAAFFVSRTLAIAAFFVSRTLSIAAFFVSRTLAMNLEIIIYIVYINSLI